MSDGDPPSATIRSGRNVNPLMIPTCNRATRGEDEPSFGATLRATPAEPNRQVRRRGARSASRSAGGLGAPGVDAPPGRPGPTSGRNVVPMSITTRRAGEEDERGRVAGPVVQEAREDRRHREPEAREQPAPARSRGHGAH